MLCICVPYFLCGIIEVQTGLLCGLGKSASSPVVSTIRNFRNEYEAHIYDKKCPAGACQKLKQIVIDPELCRGCSKCSRICPVSAISGKIKEPFTIDLNKCIRCGSCPLSRITRKNAMNIISVITGFTGARVAKNIMGKPNTMAGKF